MNAKSRDGQRHVQRSLIWAAIVSIAISALVHSVNHDESQYVAAVALMRQGLPYRDFAYLQTPLLPLLLAPLAYLPAGWVWAGVRTANAVFGIATIVLLLRALRGRASAQSAFVALVGLLCTDAFLLASSVARNDALVMVLLAAALAPLLSATDTRSSRMFAAGGLALGLAVSAKINAAMPAVGAALFVIVSARRYRGRCVVAFGTGLCLGLLPIAAMACVVPGPFRFDVFTYNFDAPVQWWSSIGQGMELGPLRRTLKLIGFASLGSILVALAGIAFDRGRSDARRLLEFMIAGGLVAAFLPVPALVQYLVPLLPPLFARFALALDAAQPTARKALLVLIGMGSIAGLVSNFVVRFAGLEPTRHVDVGREVAALADGGRVVTLSPEYVAGGGVVLDPRFAAGPFLYRIRGPLAWTAEAKGHAVPIETLDRALTSSPPAVILVGGETEPFPPAFPDGLDRPLADWARSQGYRRVQCDSGLVAFVAPRAR